VAGFGEVGEWATFHEHGLQWLSAFRAHQNHRGLIETPLLTSVPEFLMCQIWDEAQEFAFLTSSQVSDSASGIHTGRTGLSGMLLCLYYLIKS
jgi:hypothetical protein